ncbi:AMP-dependent synthetase and ligase domain protein [mine drainage metagenome]|uniref:AMP-dependent synthetase and ligase domain protein n=1 Tax=mine drainage metagenome TaxID=410659 RepID=T1B3L8_9ZZZZ
MTQTRPWLRFYGKLPPGLSYPEVTLYQAVAATAARVPDALAWDFLDTTSTYRAFLASIDACANALATLGLAAGGRILISMPTSPQGVIAFYAANKLGAVPALIHPLSTAPEIEYYLNASHARIALTLDAFYERFASIQPKLPLETLILARIPDYLPPVKRFGFWLSKGRKIPKVSADARVRWWADLMAAPHPTVPRCGRARTIRRRSCSRAVPPACPRASCCRTATSLPRVCRRLPGAEWRRAIRSSQSCRFSMASAWACA